MVSLPALLVLVLSACGSGSGVVPADDTEPPGAVPPFPVGAVPLDVPISDLLVDPGPETGSVVLRFTAPGDAGAAAADAYVVRASPQQIWPANLDRAPQVPIAQSPSAPGTSEQVVVRSLEPGRVLYFSVQAQRGTVLDPFGFAAAGRVAGRGVPTPPAGAIRLDAPATLSQSGATYLLTQDVTTSGTAFTITGRDVTLDLGGRTVTYGTGGGTSHGVFALTPTGPGFTVVRNGTLRQGGAGPHGHAVSLRGLVDARLSYLRITVSAPDTHGIWLAEARGAARIDHCSVACLTQVVSNRHYPGVNAIFVEQSSGSLEIDNNQVTASPQWGIHLTGLSSANAVLVHHNRVVGTRALVANGYMVGVHKPDADVYENLLYGESRGIHVDEEDTAGRNAWVHDNDIRAQDQPNAEYPEHWVHGIKVEGANGCRIEHNRILTTADPQHGAAYALDLQLGTARGIVARHNVVESVSTTPALPAHAVNWTYGAEGPLADDFLARFNVFTATDVLVNRWWAGGRGGLFRDNWWHRDLSQGAGHPLHFEYFGNGDTIESRGHRFVDPISTTSTLDVAQWSNPALYDSTREWTLTVVVRDGSSAVAGATVSVRDRFGQAGFDATTDADGRAAGTVVGTTVSRGPAFATANPHTITVRRGGASVWTGAQTIDGRTALLVDAATGSATRDTAAPAAPPNVRGWPLSASRALVLWEPAPDDTAVVTYLVELDGKPAGVTDERGIFLGGLTPAHAYQVSVRSVDAAGNTSPASPVATFTTRPEDRGP